MAKKIPVEKHRVRCPACGLVYDEWVTRVHHERAVRRFSYPEVTHFDCLVKAALESHRKRDAA